MNHQSRQYRDEKGHFLPGNPYRFKRGCERTLKCAKAGFAALVEKKFDGRKGAAMEFLGLRLLEDRNMLDW